MCSDYLLALALSPPVFCALVTTNSKQFWPSLLSCFAWLLLLPECSYAAVSPSDPCISGVLCPNAVPHVIFLVQLKSIPGTVFLVPVFVTSIVYWNSLMYMCLSPTCVSVPLRQGLGLIHLWILRAWLRTSNMINAKVRMVKYSESDCLISRSQQVCKMIVMSCFGSQMVDSTLNPGGIFKTVHRIVREGVLGSQRHLRRESGLVGWFSSLCRSSSTHSLPCHCWHWLLCLGAPPWHCPSWLQKMPLVLLCYSNLTS